MTRIPNQTSLSVSLEQLESRTLLSGVGHSEYELSIPRQTKAFAVGSDIYFVGNIYDEHRNAYGNMIDVLNTRMTGKENAYGQLEADGAGYQALGPPFTTAVLVGDYIVSPGGESFNIDTDTFSFQTPPAEVYENGGVALAGSDLVYAGGVQVGNIGFSAPEDAVSIFNGTTGQWSQGTPLSNGRIPFGDSLDNLALFAGESVFLFHVGFVTSTDIDIFNGSTGQWSHQSLASPIINFAIANVEHNAIFAGGDSALLEDGEVVNPTEAASSEVDIYNDQTNQVTHAALSLARDEIGTAVVGNTAIFAGGRYYKRYGRYYNESTVDLYNASTSSWTSAQLATPRLNPKSAVAGNVALFYAGETSKPSLIDVYDNATNQWSTTTLPTPLSDPQTITVGHDILFYSASSPLIEIYNTQAGTWGSTALSSQRSGMGVAVVGNQVFFGGGLGVSSESNVVDVLTFNNDVLS